MVLVKRATLLRLTLPNGRTLLTKYKRVRRNQLPQNITIARAYRGRPVQGRRPAAACPPVRAKPAAAVRPPGIMIRPARPKTRAARSAAWHRGRQEGKGLGDVVKAVASNPYAQEISKKIFTKGINYLPALFKKGTKRIKNKHLRRLAESDIALDLVDRGTKRLLRESSGLVGGIGL